MCIFDTASTINDITEEWKIYRHLQPVELWKRFILYILEAQQHTTDSLQASGGNASVTWP